MNRAYTVRPARQVAAPVSFHHKVVLLRTKLRSHEGTTLFGCARLFGDRIELDRWGLLGRRRRVIPLNSVADVDYHNLREGSNLTLFLDSGEAVELEVDRAHEWRQYYESWLRYAVLPSAKLVDRPDQALDISG